MCCTDQHDLMPAAVLSTFCVPAPTLLRVLDNWTGVFMLAYVAFIKLRLRREGEAHAKSQEAPAGVYIDQEDGIQLVGWLALERDLQWNSCVRRQSTVTNQGPLLITLLVCWSQGRHVGWYATDVLGADTKHICMDENDAESGLNNACILLPLASSLPVHQHHERCVSYRGHLCGSELVAHTPQRRAPCHALAMLCSSALPPNPRPMQPAVCMAGPATSATWAACGPAPRRRTLGSGCGMPPRACARPW